MKLQHVHLPRFSRHFQYKMMPCSVLCMDPIKRPRSPLSLRFRAPCGLSLSRLGGGHVGEVTASSEPGEGPCWPGGCPRSSKAALTIGSFLEMASVHCVFAQRVQWKQKLEKSIRLKPSCLTEKGWSTLVIVNRRFSSILSKCPVYIIFGFDVPSVQYKKLP